MRQNLKETVCNAQQKNTHTKEVYLTLIIIHSKYFPDSDWLKAHV